MLNKKLLLAAALAGFATLGISMSANAALPGYYIGGQLGWATTHWDDSDLGVQSASISNSGLAGRAFAGYQFNENWAAELGYTRFSDTDVNNINGTGSNGTINDQYAVDLMAKGILPLGCNFDTYGKLGAAYEKASASLNGVPGTIDSQDHVNPAFGVGVGYDITPNVPVDISWNRIQKAGGNIPSTDLFSVGIAYNFG